MDISPNVKAIIAWVAGIAATVIAALLIAHFENGNKQVNMPEHPGLLQYDDVAGLYSLKYPKFLEGAKQFHDGQGRLVAFGKNADFYLTGKLTDFRGFGDFMAVRFMPNSSFGKTSHDRAVVLGKMITNMLVNHHYWFGKEIVISTHRNSGSLYIEKHLELYWPHWPFNPEKEQYYLVQQVKGMNGYIVFAIANVVEDDWPKYSGEIQQSFESIKVLQKVRDKPAA